MINQKHLETITIDELAYLETITTDELAYLLKELSRQTDENEVGGLSFRAILLTASARLQVLNRVVVCSQKIRGWREELADALERVNEPIKIKPKN